MKHKNDGKKHRNTIGSKNGPFKKDGKTNHRADTKGLKNTVKYTIERTKQDIKNIEKVRKYLKQNNHDKRYNTDSEIYRDLPNLFLNTIKKNNDQDLVIQQLYAKIDQFEQLQGHISSIFEFFNIDEGGKK